MSILSEICQRTKIINEIKSSNIKKTEYDTQSSKMLVTFNNDLRYEYDDVPLKVYTRFRMSESQGKFFSTEIAKNYKYKKV